MITYFGKFQICDFPNIATSGAQPMRGAHGGILGLSVVWCGCPDAVAD